MATSKHRYGWLRDLPDQRDWVYSGLRLGKRRPLPLRASLRCDWPGILDQGSLGSCVWNALGYAFLWCLAKQSYTIFQPSRLFGYYNTRLLEGTVHEDAGCSIRDAFKVLRREGVCSEEDWPYLPQKFSVRPSARCYQRAEDSQSLYYFRVPLGDERSVMECIVEGFPVVLGMSLYESFESEAVAQTGRASLPRPTARLLGGHAVTVVGYDARRKRFELANSWGSGWGDHGFFTLPFSYLSNPNLVADAWTLRKVEGSRR